MSKIMSFTDLTVWQKGHELVIAIYKATNDFPRREDFGLTSQMRRCSVSITSNIAEGFSRKGKNEKRQFYLTSLGSLTELQNQLLIAKDVGYLKDQDFSQIANQTLQVGKLTNGLIRSIKNRS